MRTAFKHERGPSLEIGAGSAIEFDSSKGKDDNYQFRLFFQNLAWTPPHQLSGEINRWEYLYIKKKTGDD